MKVKVGFVIDPHASSFQLASRKDDYPAAILDKLQQVRVLQQTLNWKTVVIMGDLFHTSTLSWEMATAVSRIVNGWSVLPGNHDIKWRRLDLIDHTPLGFLLANNTVTDLSKNSIRIFDDVNIIGYPYHDLPVIPKANSSKDWLAVHQYIGPVQDWWDTENTRVSFDAIDEAGFAAVVAGHDHVPYPVKYTENKIPVYRFGSLSRGSKHEHNRDRIPQVMEVTFDDSLPSPGFSVRLIDLVVDRDVFRSSAIKQSFINKDMRSFVRSLEASNFGADEETADDLTARQVFKKVLADPEINTPDEVIYKVHEYFDTFGIL